MVFLQNPDPTSGIREMGETKRVELLSPIKFDIKAIAEKNKELSYGFYPKNPTGIFKQPTDEATLSIPDVNDSALLVRFYLDDQGKVTKVESSFSKELVAYMLERGMDAGEFGKLKDALKGSALDLQLTDEQRARVQAALKTYEEENMPHLKKLPHGPAPSGAIPDKGITPENARGVVQNEYGIVRGDQKQHIIGTDGAAECVIVGCYNPDTKTAAVAHVDALTTMASVGRMLDEVSQGAKEGTKIHIHLAGASRQEANSVRALRRIVKLIEQDGRFEIKSADVIRNTDPLDGDGPASFAIDAATGKFRSGVEHRDMDLGKDEAARWQINRLRVGAGERTDLLKVPEVFYKHPAPDQPGQGAYRNNPARPDAPVRLLAEHTNEFPIAPDGAGGLPRRPRGVAV